MGPGARDIIPPGSYPEGHTLIVQAKVPEDVKWAFFHLSIFGQGVDDKLEVESIDAYKWK